MILEVIISKLMVINKANYSQFEWDDRKIKYKLDAKLILKMNGNFWFISFKNLSIGWDAHQPKTSAYNKVSIGFLCIQDTNC